MSKGVSYSPRSRDIYFKAQKAILHNPAQRGPDEDRVDDAREHDPVEGDGGEEAQHRQADHRQGPRRSRRARVKTTASEFSIKYHDF